MKKAPLLQTAGVSSYRAAFHFLKPLLARGGDRVWYRNGLRAGLATPFLSDIDLSFAVAGPEEALRARSRFLAAKKIFPFLGEAHFFLPQDRDFALTALNPFERERDPDLAKVFSGAPSRAGSATEAAAFLLRLFWADRHNLGVRPHWREGKWSRHFEAVGFESGAGPFSADFLLDSFESIFPPSLDLPWRPLLKLGLTDDEGRILARIEADENLHDALLAVHPKLWFQTVLAKGLFDFSRGIRRISKRAEVSRQLIAEQMRWELASLSLQLAWELDPEAALAHARKIFTIFRFADPCGAEATLKSLLTSGRVRREEISPTACVFPAWDLNIAAGFLRACPQDRTLRPDSDLRRHSLSEALGSDFLSELAHDQRAGRRPAHCRDCFEAEDRGEFSKRLEGFDRIYNLSEGPELRLDSHRSAHLKLANACELRCLKCSSEGSSAWAKFLGKKTETSSWYLEPAFLRDFVARFRGLESLHFTGGDGLSFPGHREFLEACLEYPGAKELSLSYAINGQIDPSPLFSLWRNFRRVDLTLVLDGIEEQDEYLRFPSSWAKTESCLKLLKKIEAPIRAKVAISVNAFNAFYVPEIAGRLSGFELDLHIPEVRDFRSVASIPPALKEIVRTKITAAARDGTFPGRLAEKLSKLLEEDGCFSAETRLRLRTLDAIQKTDFARIFPEVAIFFLGPARAIDAREELTRNR